ncbi:MAG: hypothetical protein Q8N91_06980 [Candidatus Omnitrophota bacterium]|nr:hypothetical protein [Candidatus Omnitrophota bacterium]
MKNDGYSMRVKYFLIVSAAVLSVILSASVSFSQNEEEAQYRKFKLENASCDVGLLYKNTPEGTGLGISAIATGKGAQFRRWKVTEIKLCIDGRILKAEGIKKFYVREESFWRVPAAVLFVALGIADSGNGSGLENGIGKAGVALGMGLLALQAKGDIEGKRAFFNLDKKTAENIQDGRDAIEIRIEDERLHLKDTIKIGIPKIRSGAAVKDDYSRMGQDDLIKLVDTLKYEIESLEKEQASYKYGADPGYDRIQREIEELQARRGMAYNRWLEKR